MNSVERELDLLRKFANEKRGVLSESSYLKAWLSEADSVETKWLRLDAWLRSGWASRGEGDVEHLPSETVVPFIAELAAIGGGSSVFDPTCGTGLLLSLVGNILDASILHGIDIDTKTVEIARLVASENTTVFAGDSIYGDFPLEVSYDCIVAETPMGLRLNPPLCLAGVDKKLADVGEALLCQSVERLSKCGRAVFVFPPTYATQKGKRLWSSLEKIDGYLRALIHVPAGHHKAAAIDFYIVVVDKIARERVFVAQFGKDKALEREILRNYENHQGGKRLAQGCLVSLDDFNGFPALEAKEQLKQLVLRSGFSAYPFSRLVTEHEVITEEGNLAKDSSNDLFIELDGRCHALLTLSDLRNPSKNRKVLRLVLDAEKVDARFMVDSLNSEVGRLFVDSISSGSIHRRIAAQELLDSEYYLPKRDIQDKVIKVSSQLNALRAELDEIESALKRQPGAVDKQLGLLKKVNHEDTLETWIESLPFPLATILWRWRASDGSTLEQNGILLHFFEAFAEFWATIYLSAAKSDSEFWIEHSRFLHANLGKANLSFDRATFGLWKCVIESFSKKMRDLENNDTSRCSAMFGTGHSDVLSMLLDRRVLTVLQSANSMRNDHAHSGALGTRDLEIINKQLIDLVQTCRSVMGTTWEHYELIQPAECRYTKGLFHYSVRKLVGTRTPFVIAERTTIEGMDDGYLHLMDSTGDCFIKLLPFVRVMASPQTAANACYFYNRNSDQQHRFVSYHFEADSEVEGSFADTAAALDSLRPLPEI